MTGEASFETPQGAHDAASPIASVVIAAYDEAAVIGRNLRELGRGARPGELEVIVIANGCHDDTAGIARATGARVLELPEGDKAGALDAGDAVATVFPRIYLDADITVTVETVRALVAALTAVDGAAPIAAAPGRRVRLTGRPLPVRAYEAIHSRLPAVRQGLYGRGMIALSAEGRARFDRFAGLVADDLYLDSLFAPTERVVLTAVQTTIEAPSTTRDLLARLARVRRGNAALRAASAPGAVSGSDRWSWLRDVVARDWRLLPAAPFYVALTLAAERRARADRSSGGWGRDESSRRAAPDVRTAE